MSRKNDENAFWVVVLICFAIVLIYIALKLMFIVGVIGVFVTVVLLAYALNQQDTDLATKAGAGFLLSLILLVVGGAGVNFFENNPVGKSTLDASSAVVKSGSELVVARNNVETAQNNAEATILNKVAADINTNT